MASVRMAHEMVLETEECCECGMIFAVTEDFQRRRQSDKRSFTCPNGHSQSYKESPEDRLQKQLEAERRKLSNAQFELIAAEKKVKRLEKRAANGVCPCCHRQFVQMSRHMRTKHPEWVDSRG